jgi:hypothetical protein
VGCDTASTQDCRCNNGKIEARCRRRRIPIPELITITRRQHAYDVEEAKVAALREAAAEAPEEATSRWLTERAAQLEQQLPEHRRHRSL